MAAPARRHPVEMDGQLRDIEAEMMGLDEP